MELLSFLYFGDIVGQPGRKLLIKNLPSLKERYQPTFIFANGENVAGGFGITCALAEELHRAGINGISTGNHVWNQRGFWSEIDTLSCLCRPANLPPHCPGKTYIILENNGIHLGLFNLLGRGFMNMILDCPFRVAESIIETLREQDINNIIVDIHAETTAEKYALGYFLSEHGVLAVLGTHTHVQTADEQLLQQRTAYISDLGMCGPRNGVLGSSISSVLKKSIQGEPIRFEMASGLAMLNGVYIQFDPLTHQATHIERIHQVEE